MLKEVDDQSFERDVLGSVLPVLVDVSTEWCGPCKALTPLVENLAKEYQGKIAVFAIDGDRAPRVTEQLRIRGFPTVLVFKNGREVARQLGAMPKSKLVALVEEHL